MCGRYALGLGDQELLDAIEEGYPNVLERLRRHGGGSDGSDVDTGLNLLHRLRGGDVRWNRPQDFRPSFNLAPKQRAPVIRRDGNDGLAMLETMQWGLIPHWTKYPPTGPLNTINARSEALIDPSAGGMWNALKGTHRCIIPAQGYFEWQKKASTKIPHFARLRQTGFASQSSCKSKIMSDSKATTTTSPSKPILFFAGLWDTVTYLHPVESKFRPDPKEEREPYPTGNPIPLSTFTILTTTPASDLYWLHDRMPCILINEDEIFQWLDLGEIKGWKDGKGGTGDLLRSTNGLDCYRVPPEVGKIGNSSPSFIQPVSERSDGIKSFFQKQQPSPVKTKRGETVNVIKREEKWYSKPEPEGIEAKISSDDDEKGLGDDSNAPNQNKSRNPGNVKREQADSVKDIIKRDMKEKISQSASSSMTSTELTKFEPESSGKRKRGIERDDENDDDDNGIQPTCSSLTNNPSQEINDNKSIVVKKGGRQTRVVRRESPKASKEQPSITAFFKSPSKKN